MRRLRAWNKEVEGKFAGCPGLYVRLLSNGTGVDVVACNNKGEVVDSGYLLSINPSGVVFFHGGINTGLGLVLDELEALKVGSKVVAASAGEMQQHEGQHGIPEAIRLMVSSEDDMTDTISSIADELYDTEDDDVRR